jgi:DNA-directed RNA polymerase specialized sigma24 family protein
LSARLADALLVLPEAEPAGPDSEAVSRALARLTRDDQELLLLVDVEGLNRDEVSVVLGASRPVVRVRLHRARQRLVRELATEGIHPRSTQVPRGVPAASHTLTPPEVTR